MWAEVIGKKLKHFLKGECRTKEAYTTDRAPIDLINTAEPAKDISWIRKRL